MLTNTQAQSILDALDDGARYTLVSTKDKIGTGARVLQEVARLAFDERYRLFFIPDLVNLLSLARATRSQHEYCALALSSPDKGLKPLELSTLIDVFIIDQLNQHQSGTGSFLRGDGIAKKLLAYEFKIYGGARFENTVLKPFLATFESEITSTVPDWATLSHKATLLLSNLKADGIPPQLKVHAHTIKRYLQENPSMYTGSSLKGKLAQFVAAILFLRFINGYIIESTVGKSPIVVRTFANLTKLLQTLSNNLSKPDPTDFTNPDKSFEAAYKTFARTQASPLTRFLNTLALRPERFAVCNSMPDTSPTTDIRLSTLTSIARFSPTLMFSAPEADPVVSDEIPSETSLLITPSTRADSKSEEGLEDSTDIALAKSLIEFPPSERGIKKWISRNIISPLMMDPCVTLSITGMIIGATVPAWPKIGPLLLSLLSKYAPDGRDPSHYIIPLSCFSFAAGTISCAGLYKCYSLIRSCCKSDYVRIDDAEDTSPTLHWISCFETLRALYVEDTEPDKTPALKMA